MVGAPDKAVRDQASGFVATARFRGLVLGVQSADVFPSDDVQFLLCFALLRHGLACASAAHPTRWSLTNVYPS
jgi:hypothetical protein